MSATSGIGVASELASLFADANLTGKTRFIKKTLINDLTIPVKGTFDEDLDLIQMLDILQDNVPAYLLANIQPMNWLAICYVPDSAKVRDKMLYASSRASLLRSLGANLFTDSLFATSKADLTPQAYAAHKEHMSAPKPLTEREKEMAEIRASESSGSYEGTRGRVNHVGPGVGFHWSEDAEDAIVRLGQDAKCSLVVLNVDSPSENVTLHQSCVAEMNDLAKLIPLTDPSFAFFRLPPVLGSNIIFIYSCPSTSPIKSRMVYSTGASTVFLTAKQILATCPSSPSLLSRKVETNNPLELDEEYLASELNINVDNSQSLYAGQQEQKLFAKPRGPVRRR